MTKDGVVPVSGTERGHDTRPSDLEWLNEIRAAGDEGLWMNMGRTGATKRLTTAGLVRWEQTSPFVARVWAVADVSR